jgi:hypothetical protein
MEEMLMKSPGTRDRMCEKGGNDPPMVPVQSDEESAKRKETLGTVWKIFKEMHIDFCEREQMKES